VIDSHCHLADETFAQDLPDVVARARAAGLERVLVVLEAGNDQEAAQAARLQLLWPAVRFSIGIHPHNAGTYGTNPGKVAEVVRAQVKRTPAARAVGEIGLDYHYDYSPRDVQAVVFRSQVRVAQELGLPVVIHTREADQDTLRILREDRTSLRGVLHCFSGTPELARAGLDLGLHVSVAGIITFPRAGELRDVIKLVPLDRLLVETDSPFLAPIPHRGKRNEPAFVTHVAAMVAQIHDLDTAEVARRTTENFHTLFRP